MSLVFSYHWAKMSLPPLVRGNSFFNTLWFYPLTGEKLLAKNEDRICFRNAFVDIVASELQVLA